MVKINLNLFDHIVTCTIIPNVGVIFTTLFLIVSLFVQQKPIVYTVIGISYLIFALLLIIPILLCVIISPKNNNMLILNSSVFIIFGKTYDYDQITWSKYYVCKWYAMPIIFIYKKQLGGLFEMRLKNGEKIKFKIVYRDYLKLKSKINNIIEQ